jgi:hypothetical protein
MAYHSELGTWWCHYTLNPTPFTKQPIRASLGKDA